MRGRILSEHSSADRSAVSARVPRMTDSAASTDDVWTVQKILQWTTSYFEEQKIESPRLEAELLLAHARQCQRIHLYTDFEAPLTDVQRSNMREFVKRRANREPLAYITGRREFYGRDFSVGPGVLVPRPETETLVDVCLDFIPKDKVVNLCEVGFGSGCISITLARQRPKAMIRSSDVSDDAYRFAEKNVKDLGVEDQVTLSSGSCFEPLQEFVPFDGLVSNAPYIREDEMAELDPDVVNHEPEVALVAGEDGLSVIRELVDQSTKYLKPGAWIALELDPAQSDTVAALCRDTGFENVQIHNDLNGHDRVVAATWKL